MKQGNTPRILFAPDGEIFAISTGSDHCAEHECGSAAMQEHLCQGATLEKTQERKLLQRIRRHLDAQASWLGKVFSRGVSYPELLERKRLARNLQAVHLVQGSWKGEKVASVIFSRHGAPNVPMTFDENGLFGAWDERNFAFGVHGDELADKLVRFHQRLQAGGALFAGTFLNETLAHADRLNGVIIALEGYLTAEHRLALDKAQLEWEANMRLKARSRLPELEAALRAAQEKGLKTRYPGYLWPVWLDHQVDGDIAYALNPGHGVKAGYWGPYSYEELLQWCLDENKAELQPISRAVESQAVAA